MFISADIADRLRRRDRRLAHRPATSLVHAGRRRLLDDFLVAALDRAVALEEMDAIAMRVGKDLQLDMPGPRQILLDQHHIVAERCFRLALGRGERGGEITRALDDAHTLAAAPGGRLDEDGITDAVRLCLQKLLALFRPVIAWDKRHPGFRHQGLRRRFRSHGADRRCRRADEDDAGSGAGFGEIGILGEEAITGMNRLGAALPGSGDDALDREIALARRRRADPIGLVGHGDMERAGIGIGIDRDATDGETARRPHDAAGDLAAIGDEDLAEHPHIRKTPKRVFSIGALRLADKARPSTMRVSAGSITPSSQSRALA